MYFSRTISHACVCACCAVDPVCMNSFRSVAISSFVFSSASSNIACNCPFPFQFAHHFRTEFVPMFRCHLSVLSQGFHWSAFVLKKGLAAGLILHGFVGLP